MNSESYTTDQLAKLTPYQTRRTLLQALHNNQKNNKVARNKFLSAMWNARFKFGKKWLFNKEAIDRILQEASNDIK